MREHEQADDAHADYLAPQYSDQASDQAMVAPKEHPFPSPRSASHADRSLAERIAAACRATRALAFPPPARADASAQNGAAHDAATGEDTLLRAALRVLHDLALPDASTTLVAAGSSTWRMAPAADAVRTLEFDLADAPALRLGNTITVSRSRHTTLWLALEPWRDATPRVVRAVLIPVLIGEELSALFVLGFAESAGPSEGWLPTADAVTAASAAGIEMQRLRQRVAAEAQARDTYISLAAHELRSPLTSIKGYAQLLMRQAHKLAEPLPEAMLRSVEAIEQQSSRMAELVGELLDASRIRGGAIELVARPADLVAIVRGAIERRGPHHPRQIFTFATDATSLMGIWDTARIEQVMRDLLDNAARHSPDGGHIVTTVERAGNVASVSVRDEGIGITEDDRDRIFDYLYRTPISLRRNLAGLGLGLYISRHIIERHGGQLELAATRTEDPKGSEFRFTLPIEPAPEFSPRHC